MNGGGVWQLLKEGQFLEATETAEEVGKEIEPGLPNITGSYDSLIQAYNKGKTGAFSNSTEYSYEYHGFNRYNDPCTNLKMDASLSNPIYGNSSTVQPKSIRCFIWRRIS